MNLNPHSPETEPDADASFGDRRRFLQTATLLVLGGATTALLGSQAEAATKATSKTTTKQAKRTTAQKSATSKAAGSQPATTLVKATSDAANVSIPSETGGPFPADGTNGANVLTQTGVVRSDVRSSFGASTTTAAGVLLTVKLVVRNASTAKPMRGAAIYIWHCDADGNYSMYSDATVNENYLRGVQEANADGALTFTTIFPGAYPGRWPHIHFEVYPTLASARTAANAIKTSQLAFPEEACKLAYADNSYRASSGNLAGTSLARDNVFRDGWKQQLATVTGDAKNGLVATLTFAV